MAPIAVLVSIMYSLGTFNRHNEILAMQANGISLLRILSPLIATGLFISVAVFVVNDRVVPGGTMNASEIKEKKIEKTRIKKKLKKNEKILENIAFYGKENKIIYARRYSVYDNKISEIIIHAQDENQNIVSKTTAQEALWENNGWHGKNVISFHLDNIGHIIGEPEFYEEKYLDIKETPIDFKKRRHQTGFMSFEFMSFAELKDYIERLSFEKGSMIRNLKIALNQKIAFPFVNLIVVLIASPFALVNTRKGGVLMGAGISIVLVLGYYAIMTISLATGKAGFLHPIIAVWLTNIIFAFIGFLLIIRHR
jgi:lipopolysaccharide export system permease protein